MAFLPLAITGASVLAGVINSLRQPSSPFDSADVEKYLQLQQSRTLAEDASSTRRRQASAGLGGSGVVNAIISDQASRIRNQFEEQRQKLLLQLKQSEAERSQMAQQNRAGLFGNIASLGFAAYQLGQPNPFQSQLDQLAQLQAGGMGAGATMTPELQSLFNLNDLQNQFWNNPNQSPFFGSNVNMNNPSFQPMNLTRYGVGA